MRDPSLTHPSKRKSGMFWGPRLFARDDDAGRIVSYNNSPVGSARLSSLPHNESRRMRIRDHSREKRGAHDCASGEVGGGAKRSSGNHRNRRSVERWNGRDIAAARGPGTETAGA